MPNALPHNRTDTSREAAAAAEPLSGRDRKRVFDFVVARGDFGATRDEIAQELKLKTATVCPRVWELMKLGLIEKSGERRRTSGGRDAHVLVRSRPKQVVQKALF